MKILTSFPKIVLGLGLVVSAQSATLREQVDLLFPLNPTDSILSIDVSGDSVRVSVFDKEKSSTRTYTDVASTRVRTRLQESAANENVPFVQGIAAPDSTSTEGGYFSTDENSNSGNISSGRMNKLYYVTEQLTASAYFYGFALPMALDMNGDNALRMMLLSVPVSFGVQLGTVWGKPVYDAHRYAAEFYPSWAIASSYLLPWGLGVNNVFKSGSFIGMFAYPASLYFSRLEGTRRAKEPGRILLQNTFTNSGAASATLLFLTAHTLVTDNAPNDQIIPWMIMGGAVGGYIASDYYTQDYVTQGMAGNISNFAILGAMTGGYAAMLINGKSPASIFVPITLGYGAGLGVGLNLFKDTHDAYERPFYDALGMMGGAMVGATSFISGPKDFDDFRTDVGITLFTTVLGYAATHYLTQGMVESAPRNDTRRSWHMEFNPVPYAQATRKESGDITLTWFVPGLVATF